MPFNFTDFALRNSPLQSFFGGRIPKDESEEEKQPLGAAFAGFASENRGKAPTDLLAEFNTRYRQSVSPAREFLLNLLNNTSSVLMGARELPKSIRQRSLEEFFKARQQEASEERIAITEQRLAQEMQARAADRASREAIAAENNKTKEFVALGNQEVALKNIGVRQQHADDWKEVQAGRLSIDEALSRARIRNLEAQTASTKRGKNDLEFAAIQAEQVADQMGLAMDSAERQEFVLKQTLQNFGLIQEERKKSKYPPMIFGPSDVKAIADAKARGFDLSGVPARSVGAVASEMLRGTDAILTRQQRENLEKMTKTVSAVHELEQLGQGLFEGTGVEARITGLGQQIAGRIGEHPKAETYRTTRAGMRSLLARTFGEVGNLNTTEQEVALDLIPGLGSTRDEYELKFKVLHGIIKSQMLAAVQGGNRVYNEDFKGFTKAGQARRYAEQEYGPNPTSDQIREARKRILASGWVPID